MFLVKRKKIIYLKTIFGQKKLMSSTADHFGRVECCLPNLLLFSAGRRSGKYQNKYSKFDTTNR